MLLLKVHVISVCFKCFICFKGMLQVFYMDVAKVDRDDAYVAVVVHLCCKLLFPMFHLFFQTYVASVFIWIYCICFTHMFASILFGCFIYFCNSFKCFSIVFASVSDACFK
jgi:hypothetical protein